jgi:hypothetical protein
LPVSRTASQLRVSFGGLPSALRDENQGRVRFVISARDALGTSRDIWTKTVDAGPYRQRIVVHEETVPLDLSGAEVLVFDTFQERTDQSLLPFWFGASFVK